MQRIDLDNNATSPLLPPVLEAMLPYFRDPIGNPSSSHHSGRRAHKALEDARETIAGLLGAHPDEVIFTSGATEANNLALFGLAGDPPGRLVTSLIEHPCVLEPIQRLGERGFAISYLPVASTGIIQWERAAEYLRDSAAPPRLTSLMLANHETGAIQPVCALAKHLERQVVLHCDAAAAVGKIPVSFRDLGVDSLSVSPHKFHGPVGIGALLLRRGLKLRPLLWGGHQQQGRRPGTEAVPLIVGFAKALEIAAESRERNLCHGFRLRKLFIDQLRTLAAPIVVHGPDVQGAEPSRTIPSTINVSFPGCRAQTLLIALDLAGIACSTGSACSSGSLLPSPVLRAMELADPLITSAMRFSFAAQIGDSAIVEAARRISHEVNRLRQRSDV